MDSVREYHIYEPIHKHTHSLTLDSSGRPCFLVAFFLFCCCCFCFVFWCVWGVAHSSHPMTLAADLSKRNCDSVRRSCPGVTMFPRAYWASAQKLRERTVETQMEITPHICGILEAA